MTHAYSFMQVAKPQIIDCPIGAIGLIDTLARNNYRGVDFCLFEMEPNGALEKRIATRIESINGEDMPHMPELIEELKIDPLFNLSSHWDSYYMEDFKRAIEKFCG